MTRDELEQLLGKDELFQTLDVKTLVLDMVRGMDQEELLDIFWAKLPELSADELKDYFYMRRG